MATLAEINKMGVDTFVNSVLSYKEPIINLGNDDSCLTKQIEDFDSFKQSDESYRAILSDAKRMR